MRGTTTLLLVVTGAALAGSGAVRAADGDLPTSTTRGAFVLAAGDKVHGFLRGGETHAMRVHLARGDVYSFSVTAQKRGDPLVMHLTMTDSDGREVNGDARVVHYGGGKRITAGPYRAPKSGTYVIELYAQTWFGGEYWGTSSVKGARRESIKLPTDGSTTAVDVAAGSTIRIRATTAISQFVIATPDARANQVSGDDPLVQSLRGTGLASSETGTYQFGAPGAKIAPTVEISKPTWKSSTVEAPRLPDDGTHAAQFDWILNGWKEQQEATLVQALRQQELEKQAAAAPPVVGGPLPVGLATSGAARGSSSLFISSELNAAGNLSAYTTPMAGGSNDPSPLPPDAPPPHVGVPGVQPQAAPDSGFTDGGIPTRMPGAIKVPFLTCQSTIGTSMFCLTAAGDGQVGGFRDTPWTRMLHKYPAEEADATLPLGAFADGGASGSVPDDEFAVKRVFNLMTMADGTCVKKGTVTTVTHMTVDGHPVRALLASGGDTTVTWTVDGKGQVDDHDFSVVGEWTMTMHSDGSSNRFPCMLSGSENFAADTTRESLNAQLQLVPVGRRWFRPTGLVTMQLDNDEFGVHQFMLENFHPNDDATPSANQDAAQFLRVETTIITTDKTTPAEGFLQNDDFDYVLTCS